MAQRLPVTPAAACQVVNQGSAVLPLPAARQQKCVLSDLTRHQAILVASCDCRPDLPVSLLRLWFFVVLIYTERSQHAPDDPAHLTAGSCNFETLSWLANGMAKGQAA